MSDPTPDSADHPGPGVNSDDRAPRVDGAIPDADRLRDIQAIEDLAIAYGHAVDDRDWQRWQSLFTPDARVDYTSAGGTAGTPDELAAWFPDAFAAFEWTLHSMSTHEITFSGDDSASGRLHVFNRNGVTWKGESEILDVGAVYEDSYVRAGSDGNRWLFSSRVEHALYFDGGGFAAMLNRSLPA